MSTDPNVSELAETAWLAALAANRYDQERRKDAASEDCMMATETLGASVRNFRAALERVPDFNILIATEWLVEALQREKNEVVTRRLDALEDIKRRYGIHQL